MAIEAKSNTSSFYTTQNEDYGGRSTETKRARKAAKGEGVEVMTNAQESEDMREREKNTFVETKNNGSIRKEL